MTKKEVIEMIVKIEEYLQKTAYEEISWTTFLKVDKFFLDLKEKIRLEEVFDDRTRKTNRG